MGWRTGEWGVTIHDDAEGCGGVRRHRDLPAFVSLSRFWFVWLVGCARAVRVNNPRVTACEVLVWLSLRSVFTMGCGTSFVKYVLFFFNLVVAVSWNVKGEKPVTVDALGARGHRTVKSLPTWPAMLSLQHNELLLLLFSNREMTLWPSCLPAYTLVRQSGVGGNCRPSVVYDCRLR